MKGTINNKWRVWAQNDSYGDLFYDRATGKLPEMESSKAVARIIKKYIRPHQTILDVGCGGGHYLVSLDRILTVPFHYIGIDATASYVEKAKKAFSGKRASFKPSKRLTTEFLIGDIFHLPVKNDSADLVMCNNVLLHLPSIKKPLGELIRVSGKYIVIRTLIGVTSFRIKHVQQPEHFSEDGEPENFYYYNIYSENFIKSALNSFREIKKFIITEDNDFNPEKIGISNYKNRKKPDNVTQMVQNMQVNNYIIQPWKFLIIEKK